MTYVVLICPQGHKSAVPKEFAGKTAMCPFCHALMVIPDSGPIIAAVPVAAPLPVPAPVPAPAPMASPVGAPAPSDAVNAPPMEPKGPSRFPDFEINDLGLVPLDEPPPRTPGDGRSTERRTGAQEPEVFPMDRALKPCDAGLVPEDDLADFEEPSLIPEDAIEESSLPVAAPAELIGNTSLPIAAPAEPMSHTSLPVASPAAPATIPLAAEELVIGRPVRKRKKRPPDSATVPVKKTNRGLPIVNLGLGFHYVRLIVLVAAMIDLVFFLVTLTAAFMYMSMTMAGLSIVSAVVLIILLWILPVLGITGSILCLFVPTQSRSLPMIIISLCLDGIQFPFVMVLTFIKTDSTGFLVLDLVALLLSVAAWTFFMVFLAVLCKYLEEENMAYEAFRLIRKGITLFVCYMLTQVIFRAIVAGLFPGSKEMAADGLFMWWLLFFLLVQVTIIWVIIIVRFLFEIIALIGSIRQVILSRW